MCKMMIMNVQQSRQIKSATSEMTKTKTRINEKLMKNLKMNEYSGKEFKLKAQSATIMS